MVDLDLLNAQNRPGPLAATIRSLAPLILGLFLATGLHIFFGKFDYPFYSKVITDIGINIILAVSLTLVNGFTGQFSIGHAGFMAIGGYTAATITYYGSYRIWGSPDARGGLISWALDFGIFEGSWIASGDLLFLVATLVGGLVAAVTGYIVGLPSLRLRGDYLAIVTLGFGEITRVLFQASESRISDVEAIKSTAWPKLFTHLGGALGLTGLPFYTTLFWVFAFVVIMLLVAHRLKQSSVGRAFLSIREDEIAAEAMGVHTTRLKVQAFVVSAFFAGIAGSLFAHQVGSINASELGFMKSFDVVIMVVLGGMGSISGACLAAIILTILPEALRAVAEYRMVVYAFLLVLMMIGRPQGLFGVHEIWEFRFRRRKVAAPEVSA